MVDIVVQNRTGGAFTSATITDSLRVRGENAVNISLNLSPADVASYQAQGNDLVLTLVNGETITIVDFYDVDGPVKNRLFLSENGELVQAALPQSAETAVLNGLVSDVAISNATAPLVFEGSTVLATTGGAAGAGLSSGGLIAAGGLGLLALAGAAGGGGGGSNETPAPDAPTVTQSSGARLAGTDTPGNTIAVDIDGDGTPEYSALVGPDGNWEVKPNPAVPDGSTVSVTSTSPGGVQSAPTTTTVDSAAPIAPQVNSTNGSTVSGTGEPGATVNIDTNGDGEPDVTTTVGDDGNWSADIAPQLPDGTDVTVTQADPSGNESPPTTVTSDATPPAAPTVNPTNGTSVTGTGEPGGTVGIDTNNDGTPDVTTTIGDDGTWSVPLDPAVGNGQIISVAQTDSAGNPSTPTTATVDTDADLAPEVNPTNGLEVSGTGVPGSTVEIDTDGSGTPNVTDIVVQLDGTWTTTLPNQLTDNTDISVTQRDTAGNVSPATTATTDSKAPDAPTVRPSGGEQVFGTGEPGATVGIDTNNDGTPDVTAVVGTDGTWTATISPEVADGDPIAITQTDVAGNTSPPTNITIDSAAPGIPVVDPTDGNSISGSGEPGATITINVDGRDPITTTVGTDGTWTAPLSPSVPDGTAVSVTQTDPAGNVGPANDLVTDSSAPIAPVINATDGTTISGTGEPGATINLDLNDDGTFTATAVVLADGTWSFTPTTPLTDDTVIGVTQTDPAGNVSPEANASVDGSAPDPAVVNPTDGTQVSGTAEPGTQVTIAVDDGRDPITVTVDDQGNWTTPLTPPAPNGTDITVTPIDAAGNAGTPTTQTADSVAPNAPTIAPTDGSTASGTGEPGATVTVSVNGGGDPITVTVDDQGNWTTPLTPAAPNGSDITATQTDPAGNEGQPTTQTVDNAAPAAPAIDPTNGTTITGTGEPGATVNLDLNNDGTFTDTAVVAANGAWTFTPTTPLADGTVVGATQSDASGNTSPEANGTVDGSAPAAPTITTSDDASVGGTAEANSEVAVTIGGVGYTATADGSGNWSVTPEAPDTFVDNEAISATVTDATGNTSAATAGVIGTDSDGDLVADSVDIDDDNDGILDTTESTQSAFTQEFFGTFGTLDSSTQSRDLQGGDPDGAGPYQYGNLNTTTNPLNPAERYTVTSGEHANGAHSGSLWQFNGGTTGLANDAFLAVNGSDVTSNTVFFNESVDLLNGITYTFSFDHRGGIPSSEYNTRMEIRDASGTLVQTITADDPAADWETASADVVSTGGTYTVQIINNVTTGNDFAIDDISVTTATGAAESDTDGDGTFDSLDTDSDGDGTLDNAEAQNGNTFIAASGVDANNNGLDDAYEGTAGTTGLNADGIGLLPADTGGDLRPDHLDPATSGPAQNTSQSVSASVSSDTIALDGGEVQLDLDAIGDGEIENVDISGTGANNLTISLEDVVSVTGDENTLHIFGDGDDTVTQTGFTPTGNTVSENGVTFDEFTGGAATLLIEDDLAGTGV